MKKTKTTAKKLFLNKETVTVLTPNQQRYIIGGVTTTDTTPTPTIPDTGKIDTGIKSKVTRTGH